MLKTLSTGALSAALAAGMLTASLPGNVRADDDRARAPFKHVLLISIDGMHAVDYENCVKAGTCPTLAKLGRHGVSYTRTSAAKPSDSFPGLMAIVSGGSPKTVGAFYDVAYDRVLAPPTITTGNGVAGGTCTPGVANGTTTEYEEGIDLDQTQLNGGTRGAALTDGTALAIDPRRLPRDPLNGCQPVYPWNFVRTNTIFGVVHAAGGYTAWSDKHPAYSSVSGPGPGTTPANLDDFYAPEINSTVIGLPGVTTATGMSCATIADPAADLSAWTNSFANVQCYDQLKVNGILNQIEGRTHDGARRAPVPTVFGMNFQAVSVAQKLIEKGVKGGYLDAKATPSPKLSGEFAFVDAALGQMTASLSRKGLLDKTLIVITAKHGQSPIDPARYVAQTKTGTSPANILAAYLPFSESPLNPTGIGPTEDDVSQIWLADAGNTELAVGLLEENAAAAGIGEILHGPTLETQFNKPGIPLAGDSRTPDIIVLPNIGVTYSSSGKKQAEHGGFAPDDTNVLLLVANPSIESRTLTSFVETAQVAPTILRALGLDPSALESVRREGTPVLPGLF
jgi:Type I phosphodiesterase / nucleotide pyrophosphatase